MDLEVSSVIGAEVPEASLDWESEGASEAANTLPEETAQRGVKVESGGSEGSLEARGSVCVLLYLQAVLGGREGSCGDCEDREGAVSQGCHPTWENHPFLYFPITPTSAP